MNFFTLVNIMFRRILLENFKTFGKTELDFTDGNLGRANHIALLYGPNGSGKSSIIDAVAFLKLSALTLDAETDVRELASSARRYGSEGPMSLHYWFTNDHEDGEYLMEFDPEGNLIRERLDYTINKNSGCIYDLRAEGEDRMVFSRQLFKSVAAKDAFEYEVRKNWGRHTFLSILWREQKECGRRELSELLGTGVLDFIRYVDEIVICRPGYENLGPRQVDRCPESGIGGDEDSLEGFAAAADAFLPSMFKGVTSARYQSSDDGSYMMVIGKEGTDAEIPLEEESQGIREAVRILPGLLKTAGGGVALIDDVEHCIHELVLKTIFEKCLPEAPGQIIAATHSTVLLEEASPRNVFMVDDGRIVPITSIERTQKNHNNRTRYFKGVFGALPDPAPVDLIGLARSDSNKNII